MIYRLGIFVLTFLPLLLFAQLHPFSPMAVYGPLFRDAQVSGIALGKQLLTAQAIKSPEVITKEYITLKDSLNKKLTRKQRGNSIDTNTLKIFLTKNFVFPKPVGDSIFLTYDTTVMLENYIKNSWRKLKCKSDSGIGNSMLYLPYPYIGCGPEANELHYWDSYFIMLGLKECGEYEMMENIVKNLAYLINRYGHIPAVNRTYSLGRSGPPFLSLMIDLLADVKGDDVYLTYLPELEKEYLFWMEGSDSIRSGSSYKRVVKFNDGTVMNRYWAPYGEPRPEYYAEDLELALNTKGNYKELLQDLGAAAESGWADNSRWIEERSSIDKTKCTQILPVDLNCLLHNLECLLRDIYKKKADNQKVIYYAEQILNREVKLDFLFWDENLSFYTDYNYKNKTTTGHISMAGLFPFLFKARYRPFSAERIELVVETLQKNLLTEGGATNSAVQNENQLWEAPWGAASMQWVAVQALQRNNYSDLAKKIALNWVNLSWDVYRKTGWLLKYYDVMKGAQRYENGTKPFTENFACNNGVLLYFINRFEMHNEKETTNEKK
jgi:alpha,alpha-trehalase